MLSHGFFSFRRGVLMLIVGSGREEEGSRPQACIAIVIAGTEREKINLICLRS